MNCRKMNISKNNPKFDQKNEMFRGAIKKALEEKKISQRRCALDNEIDYINFNKFLNGHRTLPLEDIERVFVYLKLTIKYK